MNGRTAARRMFLRRDSDGEVFEVLGTGHHHFPDRWRFVLWLRRLGTIAYLHCEPINLSYNFTALPFPPPAERTDR